MGIGIGLAMRIGIGIEIDRDREGEDLRCSSGGEARPASPPIAPP